MNEKLKSQIAELWDSLNRKRVRMYWEDYEIKNTVDFLFEVLESFQIDIQKGVESDGKLYYDVNQKRDATFEYGDIQYPYWEKEDG